MPVMKARRRRLITIEHRAEDGKDSMGSTVKGAWQTLVTLWAEYQSGGGKEGSTNRAISEITDGRFYFPRTHHLITASMRVKENPPGKDEIIYEIVSADLVRGDKRHELRVKRSG